MKKLFVSHKESLPQLRDFEKVLMEVVGIKPLLLEDQARKGKPPRELTEEYMKQCDGILFLLTRDMVRNQEWHPSTSVAIEIEMASKLFSKNKRIYMLEEGVDFPAMAEMTTYISFSWENIMPGLVKLTKDFVEVGLIRGEPLISDLMLSETEQLFVLEQIAMDPKCFLPFEFLSAAYQKRFGRDNADFNVLVTQLERKRFVNRDSMVIRLPAGGTIKASGIRIVKDGLELLGVVRNQRRVKKGAEVQQVLRKLGIVGKG